MQRHRHDGHTATKRAVLVPRSKWWEQREIGSLSGLSKQKRSENKCKRGRISLLATREQAFARTM